MILERLSEQDIGIQLVNITIQDPSRLPPKSWKLSRPWKPPSREKKLP